MQTIWKYTLTPPPVRLTMPQGAQILAVQEQHGQACLWAMVDSAAPLVEREFEVYSTGHEIPALDAGEERVHVGTFQLEGGMLVFHVFERRPV